MGKTQVRGSGPEADSVRPGPNSPGAADVVRLSINLAPDVATALKDLASARGLSITEAVRRAIAVWKFVEDERARGHRLAVVESDGKTERIREVVLL